MDRREFLAATAVAAVSPNSKLDKLSQSTSRQYIELRRYHLLPGRKQRAFIAFVGDAAIPAMNRAGVGRVGAFTVVYGENAPSLLLVLTHQTLESVVSLRDHLAADTVYARAGAAILVISSELPELVGISDRALHSAELDLVGHGRGAVRVDIVDALCRDAEFVEHMPHQTRLAFLRRLGQVICVRIGFDPDNLRMDFCTASLRRGQALHQQRAPAMRGHKAFAPRSTS